MKQWDDTLVLYVTMKAVDIVGMFTVHIMGRTEEKSTNSNNKNIFMSSL